MTPAPIHCAAALPCLSLICAALATSSAAWADETNMLEVRAGEAVELPTHGFVDLAREGAIEFWYRHQSDQQARRAFTEKEFTEEAYSVVLAVGEGEDLAFAVVIGPGTRDDQASVGVLNDLSDLADRSKLNGALARLSQKDDFGGRATIQFVKGATYHILIAKQRDRAGLRVFVDGRLQGTLNTEFGDTLGRSILLGQAPAAFGAAQAPPPIFPFDGSIGGLRIWRTGDFEESGATRLAKFGRLIEVADLTTLPEYGALTAYGDFVGERWDAAGLQRVRGAAPRLRLADPLAGTWVPEGASVTQRRADASVFEDYPVYTFVPATATPLPLQRADRAYNVFEDSNYIGTLAAAGGGAPERWTFQHADGWSQLTVEHTALGLERKLRWSLAGMPRDRAFAGARSGTVVLQRRTLDELGITSPSAQRLTPQEAAERSRNDDMTMVFLYTAYPKFFDQLYGSYNIVKMDPWNLFESGVGTDRNVLRAPTADQMFLLNKSEQLIMPYDLEVLQSQLSLDNSTSKLVSTASDYNSALTSRIGAGVSGSVTVGTGAASPVSASGTVNMSVVVQSETVRELARQDSASTEKILRSKWDKKYTLLHRKEVTRISDEYADALRTLQAECSGASPDAWRRRAFAFFDTWGTHYPFATVFGSLELTETTVNDEMRMASVNQQGSFEVTINEGKTGATGAEKAGSTSSLKTGTTLVRAFGTEQAPVPIAVDLRPLHDLLTPQQFPHEPQIYIELRHLLGNLLNEYRAQRLTDAVDALPPAQRARASSALAALGSRAEAPPEYKLLGVRYTGVSARGPGGQGSGLETIARLMSADIDFALDGSIDFIPSVTRADGYHRRTNSDPARPVRIDVPPALRAEADAFLAANPRIQVVGPTKPTDETRVLRIGAERTSVERFGAPLRRELLVKVPKGALEDFVYVQVRADFQLGGPLDPDMESMFSSLFGGTPPQAKSLSPWYLLRSELHRPAGQNPILNLKNSAGQVAQVYFDDLYDSHSNAGGVLWANETPATVTLSGPISADAGLPPITSATATLKKELRDASNRKFAFKSPIDGAWRTGETVLPLHVSPYGVFVELVVGFEYALLPDFKDAVAGRPDLLPESTWGSFSPGAKVMDVDPMVGRTTHTMRPPPSAPLADTLVTGGALVQTHRLKVADQPLELATRGFGSIEFMGAAPTRSWAFVEHEPGEWMIVSTLDGRALSTEQGVACASPRRGAPEQLWVPLPVQERPSTYRFFNKRDRRYLARAAEPSGETRVTLASATGSSAYDTAFVVDPPLDLSPNSQLQRTQSIESARATALVDDLSRAIKDRFQPLRALEEEPALAQLWECYRASFDANGDGQVDAAEGSGRGNKGWPYPITASAYPALMRAELKLSEQSEAQRRATLSGSWDEWQFVRFTLVTERVAKQLDLDLNQSLDREECAPVLATALFEGKTFDDLDLDHNGAWTMSELRSVCMTIARSIPVEAAPTAPDAELPESAQGYEVILVTSGSAKVPVIKAVRAATNLGLKEAKALVDQAPSSLGVFASKQEAQAFAKLITDAGGTIDVRAK
ncbi:MAG: ribosomal protein L7/L12 [Planctomycetota bacterium]